MADNVAVTEGAGKSIATDDVGGQQYQRIKLDLGTDGAAAPALAGAGAVATGVQRVTLASDDPAVALLTTIDSDTNTIQTDTTSIDGKITACNTGAVVISSGTVTNLSQMGGQALSMGEGVIAAGTQRVSLATDDDGVAHLATIAGDTTSLDGKVTACNTGAVVISSGTVTTITNDVSIDDGGNVISVDDGASSLTVDTTGTAGLEVVQGTAGDLNCTEASAANSLTALQIIDDWDATHDSAASADGVQLMAAYDSTKPTAVADGDAVRVLSDEYGRLLSGVEKTCWQAVFDSADASAEANVVHASAASTIVVVQSYIISSDTELWVKLQDEDSKALTGKFWLKAGGGVAITLPDKAPIVLGVDKDLEVITEGAGDVSVSATGYTIPG